MLQQLENSNILDVCPLTPMQEGIYFHFLYDRNAPSFFVQLAYRLQGNVQIPYVEQSLRVLHQRHEVLRTIFNHERTGKPLQVILKNGRVDFSFHDFSGMTEAQAEKQLAGLKQHDKAKLFDLNRDVLMRTCLIKLSHDVYEIIWSHHHILMDGWCSNIIISEFDAVYQSMVHQRPLQLPPVVSFRNYIRWLQQHDTTASLKYWKNYLKDYAGQTGLPRYLYNPKGAPYDNRQLALMLDEGMMDGLRQLGSRCQVTLSNIIQAVWGMALCRYKGENDAVFGLVVSGRPSTLKGVESMVGLFINTIPVRVSFNNIPFSSLLVKLRHDNLQGEQFGYISLADIQAATGLENNLLDHAMVIENFPDAASIDTFIRNQAPSADEMRATESTAFEQSNYDLDIRAGFGKSQGVIVLRYNANAFADDQMIMIRDYVSHVLQRIIENPHLLCEQLLTVTPAELALLNKFNETERAFPREKTFPSLLHEITQQQPERPAVVFGREVVTYKQFYHRSMDVAGLMIAGGVKQESVVGLLMERSPRMMEAIVGAWTAGAAYLPLDTEHPIERLCWVCRDASIELLVTDSANIKTAQQLQWLCPNLRVVYCVDSEDVYAIQERENESMKRELWEYVGTTASDDITAGGWFSSYTGQPLTRDEMDEYVLNTVSKLTPHLSAESKVLEIGCASGLTMFALAPRVAKYVGIDLSSSVIYRNRDIIQRNGYTNIELHHLYAHEVDFISEHDFDVIVINSVVQNFHGLNYLRKVVSKCLTLLKHRGVIFFGDVMDLDRRERFLHSLKEFAKDNVSQHKTKLDWTEELFIARQFFAELPALFPEISRVESSDKTYTIENELSLYRYDTLLFIDKNQRAQPVSVSKKLLDIRALENIKPADVDHSHPRGLAYIIYTSGSTGNPKGAMVEHIGMNNHLFAKVDAFGIGPSSRVLQNARQTFDISVWQFFSALIAGGTTYIYPQQLALSLEQFLSQLQRDAISVAEVVPSYLDVILDECAHDRRVFPALRFMIATGEPLHREQVARWLALYPSIPIANAYGPTEASDDITHLIITEPVKTSSVALGSPIQNMNIWVLNERLQLCAPGVKGEICVVGIGVGRGYVGNASKTSAAFIDHPLNASFPGYKMYRTGDLGQYLPDGTLLFAGRKDHQVKVRGFRIELGEIESKIQNIAGVRSAAVCDLTNASGQKYLVAYVVMESGPLSIDDVKKQLLHQLPEYMIPEQFIFLDALPLNSNGKIDRKKLPAPTFDAAEAGMPPATETEQRLAVIWEEVLQCNGVTHRDNFFRRGGHSLKATRLASLVRKELGADIQLRDVFEHPTLQEMAERIDASAGVALEDVSPAPLAEFYPASHAQKRMWILSQFKEASLAYNVFNAWILQGKFNMDVFKTAVARLVARHEILCTTFRMDSTALVQIIHPATHFEDVVVVSSIAGNNAGTIEESASQIMRAHDATTFDLEKGPLLNFIVMRYLPEQHFCMLKIHHIICDGWSMQLLFNELLTIYAALAKGSEPDLQPLTLQCKDFSVFQRNQIERGIYKSHQQYWHKVLQGPLEPLRIPTVKPRPETQTFEGTNHTFQFSRGTYQNLVVLAEASNASLFMTLVALTDVLLYRYTGQRDIVFGTSVAGRQRKEQELQIGFYVNTLPLRMGLSGSQDFKSLLGGVRETVLGAFQHQDYPFDLLVDELSLQRDLSRSAIFDVLVELQNYQHDLSLPDVPVDSGLTIAPYGQAKSKGIFDLNFEFREHQHDLWLTINYNTDLYTEQQVQRMAYHLEILANGVTANPGQPLDDLAMLTAAETTQLRMFNAITTRAEPRLTVPQLVASQMEKMPQRLALADEHQQRTYEELQRNYQVLASWLNENSADSSSVAMLIDNGCQGAEVMMASWHAGKAIMPLPSFFSADRLADMINATETNTLLFGKNYIHIANELQWTCPRLKTIMCTDSENIYGEKEPVLESMNKEMWEMVGKRSEDEITGGGWIDSYTGKPLSREAMAEYAENTLVKLRDHLGASTRVLEIGCASGITMFHIAPHVGYYLGTDLSATILEKNERIIRARGLDHVKQACLVADEIDTLNESDFDIIIINSVIQNFSGLNYLRQVLLKCITLLKDRGIMFIGDVMDIATKQALLEDIRQQRLTNGLKDTLSFDDHRFYSRAFFEDLPASIPAVRNVVHTDKIGLIKNELSKFRFDCLVYVDKTQPQTARTSRKIQTDRRALQYGANNTSFSTSWPAPDAIALIASRQEAPFELFTVTHGALQSRVRNYAGLFEGICAHATLHNIAYAFVDSASQVFAPLVSGGVSVIPSTETLSSPEHLLAMMKRYNVRGAAFTPEYLSRLIDQGSESHELQKVLIIGESISQELAKRWLKKLPESELIAVAGLPETGFISSASTRKTTVLTTHQPLPGMHLYFVNDKMQPGPPVIFGRLCVAGEGLASGYISKSSAFTNTHFFGDPKFVFRSDRTGRWLPDGSVAIHGYRQSATDIDAHMADLEKIESALFSIADVRYAFVKGFTDADGHRQIGAFVCLSKSAGDSRHVQKTIRMALPGNITLAFIRILDGLPVDAYGAIDQHSVYFDCDIAHAEIEQEATVTLLDQKLAKIWEDVLDRKSIGLYDNFFEMGGHSLKATRVVSRMEKELQVKLSLTDLFVAPTLASLSELVKKARRTTFTFIDRIPVQQDYPLSHAQKRLWILDQLDPSLRAYNMPSAYLITGNLNADALSQSFQLLVSRHEILRTSFVLRNGEPRQVVHSVEGSGFSVKRLEMTSSTDVDDVIRTVCDSEASFHFNLEEPTLLRVILLHLANKRHALIINIHHIISDGWSSDIMVKELIVNYQHLVNDSQWEPVPLNIQYKDYASWQIAQLQKERAEASRSYWLRKFESDVPVLDMPTDFPRPKIQDYAGDAQRFILEKELTLALRQMSQKQGTSLYILLVSFVKLFLHKYTGQNDLVIATPVSGRDHADLDNQIGFYVNTLVLRTRVDSDWPFTTFLSHVRNEVLESFEHQFYPFDLLVDELRLPRDLGRTPLFSVMVTYWKHEGIETKASGEMRIEPFAMQNASSKLDMTFHFVEAGDSLGVNIEYASALFSEERMIRLERYVTTMIRQVIAEDLRPVSKIRLANEEEIFGSLAVFNKASDHLSESTDILTLYSSQVAQRPDQVIVVGEHTELTYKQLDDKSTQLSILLSQQGAHDGERIGIYVNNIADWFTAALAILKTGRAFVSCSPSYPDDVAEFIFTDANVAVIIASRDKTPGMPVSVVYVDTVLNPQDYVSPSIESRRVLPEQLACVRYLTGRDGELVGIAASHHVVAQELLEYRRIFQNIRREDGILLFATEMSLISAAQSFWPLIQGLCMTQITSFDEAGTDRLTNVVRKHRIQTIQINSTRELTTLLKVPLQHSFDGVKNVVYAGSYISNEAFERMRLKFNHATLYGILGEEFPLIAIVQSPGSRYSGTAVHGSPLRTNNILVLSEAGIAQPAGVMGELAIRGPGVAEEYFSVSDKGFRSRWNTQTFAGKTATFFSTGMRAAWFEDGTLDLSGYLDDHVRLQGHPVDLKQVEYNLLRSSLVDAAAVVVQESGEPLISRLVAFVVAGKNYTSAAAIAYLHDHLPASAIPAVWIELHELPLTFAGKLDRSRLPVVERSPLSTNSAESPKSEQEEKLVALWQQELGVSVGLHDNFFEMGGHSLKAVRLISSLSKVFKAELTLRDIFLYPTAAKLNQVITERLGNQQTVPLTPVAVSDHYPVSHAQKRIWVLCQFENASVAYNMPYPMYVSGSLNVDTLKRALTTIVDRHESLRTYFQMQGEELRQFIKPNAAPLFSFYDLRTDADPDAIAESLVAAESKRAFDLEKGPLMSILVARLRDTEYVVMFTIHHIIADGWSMEVFGNELFTIYSHYSNGEENPLPTLAIQYKDYTVWQNKQLEGDNLKRFRDYWHNKLVAPLPVLELPAYKKRPDVLSYNGATLQHRFSPGFLERVNKFSNSRNTSLFIVLLSMVKALFHRYTDQTDIILGISSAGRNQKELENLIGFFINTLAIRSTVRGDQSYLDLLEEVKNNVLEAIDHQAYPFDRLVDEVVHTRSPDRSAIFDVLVEFQNFENTISRVADSRALDLDVTPFPVKTNTSIFDLNIFFTVEGNLLQCNVNYNSDLYTHDQVLGMVVHLEHLATAVMEKPGKFVGDYDYLPPAEIRLLDQFNNTEVEFDSNETVCTLIAQQAEAHHTRVALVHGNAAVSYGDVMLTARRIAKLLHDTEREPTLVGILMDRSSLMVECILGTWLAGQAYLPFDTDSPAQRLQTIAADSGIRILLVSKTYLHIANELQWSCDQLRTVICADTDDFYAVPEPEKESMNKEMWEAVGQRAADDIEGGGWINSYTGQPFSRAEMDEYANNTVAKLQPYLHADTRVLEIGCASGITMFRVASQVRYYMGTDLSQTILDRNKKRIDEEGLTNISLECVYAHAIDSIDERDFDVIIINSVAQNFSGLNYFRMVLKKCMTLLSSRGIIFIGDIMDVDTRHDLLREIRAAHVLRGQGSNGAVPDFTDHQFYARSFFDDLRSQYPSIKAVEATRKLGSISNELSKFRYDTILHIDKQSIGEPVTAMKQQLDMRHFASAGESLFDYSSGDGVAYVIYTSGSTGAPKGVMVEHKGMLNHLYAKVETFAIDHESRILQNANATFDISVWQFFAALVKGGTTIIYEKEVALDAGYFWYRLAYDKVTIAEVVPSYLDVLLVEKNHDVTGGSLKYMLVTGELLPRPLVTRWFRAFPEIPLANAYGPTEASDDITHYCMHHDRDDQRVPLGMPIRNMKIYVVDHQLVRCPVGVKGEICVAGVGVGRGYVNDVEKTQRAFVRNPFTTDKAYAKLYRTGDTGRWLPDGRLEYFGRADHQVKIRGHRIELGEIDNQLLTLPQIQNAAVIDHADEQGDKFLVAYVTVNHMQVTEEQLISALRNVLPEYLIPRKIEVLEAMPVTGNGKIDRKALRDRKLHASSTVIHYQGPRNAVERTLIDIWEQVLNRTPIGIHDDFFELGGHSLKATRVVSRVLSELKVKIEFKSIFSRPTIAGLAEVIQASHASADDRIVKAPAAAFYNLSHAQKRLWFMSQFEAASLAYNLDWAYRFQGDFSVDAWTKAHLTIIERHESLRTVFVDIGGEPKQLVLPLDQQLFQPVFIDLQEQENAKDLVFQHVNREVTTPFVLSEGPLIRTKIIRAGADVHCILFTIHHLAADGWSLQILFRELLESYSAYKNGGQPQLQPLQIQYKDYVYWQNQRLTEENMAGLKKYWQNKLGGNLPVLDLPVSKKRPPLQTYNGNQLYFIFPAEVLAGLYALAKDSRSSLFTAIITVLNAMFHKLTGQTDIIIGTSASGRLRKELEDQIGFYLNTLALRTTFSGTDTITDLAEKIKTTVVDAFDHQEYPFDRLVEELSVVRDLSRSQVFDVLVLLQNIELETENKAAANGLSGLKIEQLEAETIASQGDLLFNFTERANTLHLTLLYNTDVFTREEAFRLSMYFEHTIRTFTQRPAITLREISLLTEGEHTILESFHGPLVPLSSLTVHGHISEQARKYPDAVAIRDAASQLTYAELEARSNQLANRLRSIAGANVKEATVVVALPRDVRFAVVVLGIWKADMAYVPVDASWPASRVNAIMSDARPVAMITREVRSGVDPGTAALVLIDTLWEEISGLSEITPVSAGTLQSLAYVLYTSGSTGKPKGVMIQHDGMMNHMRAKVNLLSLHRNDRVLQNASTTFDISVWQLFAAMLEGGTTVVYDDEKVLDTSKFFEYLEVDGITVAEVVPTYMNTVLSEAHATASVPSLRYMLVTGENVATELVAKWFRQFPQVPLVNAYGPTEASDDITHHVMTGPVEGERVPVGKAVDNMKLYVVDENLALCPVGVKGEICVAGVGVGRGYLGDDGRTNAVFIRNPFDSGAYEKMYRTGDVGRWLADGSLEFFGRKDQQVKIRGYRIELGEIENVLRKLPGVSACAVQDFSNADATRYLAAFVCLENDATLTSEVQQYLHRELPGYMVPSAIQVLDALPLTQNGKVDRGRLPKPDFSGVASSYKPSATPLQQTLVEIWEEVLDRRPVGITDNFFAIGGHSLKATQVISQVLKRGKVRIDLKTFFLCPTIEELAAYLVNAQPEKYSPIEPAAASERYPLSYSQQRLWLLCQTQEFSVAYNLTDAYKINGSLNVHALGLAFASLVTRHESLRTVFEHAGLDVFQRILRVEQARFKLMVHSMTSEKRVDEILADEATTAFDLSKDSLIRANLFQVNASEFVLTITLHHIITDGWSFNVLIRDLLHYYSLHTGGQLGTLEPLPIQYKDYAAWQKKLILGESGTNQRKFWLAQFKTMPAKLRLPRDVESYDRNNNDGGEVQYETGVALVARIKMLQRQNRATPFLFHAALTVTLLHRLTGQQDIVVGVPTAGREHPDLEKLIGFFVNTIALRVHVEGSDSFNEVLQRVSHLFKDVLNHQTYPFDALVSDLGLSGEQNPLFDVMLVPSNVDISIHGLDGVTPANSGADPLLVIEPVANKTLKTQMDMSFHFFENDERISGAIQYRAAIFEAATMEMVRQKLLTLMEAVVQRPNEPLSKVLLPAMTNKPVRLPDAEELDF